MFLLSFLHFDHLFDQINTSFNSKVTAVQAQIIRFCISPFIRTIVVVIAGTLLIFLDQHFFALVRRNLLDIFDPLDAVLERRMNIHTETIIKIFQSIICTAAHKYTRSLRRNVFDRIKRSQKYFVIQWKIK